MPRTIGSKGSDDHDKLVRDLIQKRDYFWGALTPRFQEMVGDTKLWLGYREDKRKDDEKWRSWSWMGDPFQLTTTETDSWMEILNSIDPPYQAEGVGTEDEWKARGYERYIDYFLRGNKWTWSLEMALRGLSIRGWTVFKPIWREFKFSPIRRPTREQLIAWDEAVNDALKTGQITSPPDAQKQPQEFQGWLQNTQMIVPGFPSPPGPAPSETVQYRGPWLSRPSPFEMLFEPAIEDWNEQPIIMQRVVKPRKWTEAQVAAGKFDEAQVTAAGTGAENRLNQWDRQIAEQLGFKSDDQDPDRQKDDEFYEIWRPFEPTDQYLVLMNRSAIVNVSTDHPYWYRGSPYVAIRNVPVERRAIGLGSYAQLRRTFSDRLLFRDLLLDNLVLATMGVWIKSRNAGIPEMQRLLKPGMVMDVNDVNGLSNKWTTVNGFAELLKVGEVLLNDENLMLGTGGNVRGQEAPIGRVSATEAQGRLTQALVRHKKKAERYEEELSAILPMCLYLAYQEMPEEDPVLAAVRAGIVGQDEQDPLKNPPDPTTNQPEFTRENFGEVLRFNVRFRGATSKINREIQAQQTKDFLATVASVQNAAGIPVPLMSPAELRNLMKRNYQLLGFKGRDQVFTKEGDAAVTQMVQAYLQTAANAPKAAALQGAQVDQQLNAIQNPQPAPQRPPTESINYKDVPPDVQRQMEQQAGLQPSALGNQPNPALQPRGPSNGQPPQGPPQGG